VALIHAWAVAAIALTACVSASVLIAVGRRAAHQAGDLGAVSHQWIVQHREQPTCDSR